MSRDIEVTYIPGHGVCPECGNTLENGWARIKVTRKPPHLVCRGCVDVTIDRLLGKSREKYQGDA